MTALAVLNLGCGGGGQKVTVLKLAHGLDITHPVHKAMVYMAERVQEKSGGRLRIDIYPNEQLGSERECIEQLQFGSLAMTKTSSSPLESFIPELAVYGLPYVFRDAEHAWKVWNGEIGKRLLAAGEKVGLKGLCYYDAGARSFYTRNRPIYTPDDLKGLKIRVQKSNVALRMIQVFGASATPIDWGELYTSLQQGVVDGAENNPPSFYTSRHYEICKYYTLDEHTRVPDVLLISTAVWKKLSPEFQQILQEAADESVPYQRQLWDEMVQRSLEEVKKAGVQIIIPDKEPFRQRAAAMYREYEGTEIGKLAKEIQAIQ
ncbi:MAG: TRAP transporter substrate-binding protein [candidate division KSB1 bacterium]|nr:TRAP transporter substrate-binding protein [candidate division KSB1 bacterium]